MPVVYQKKVKVLSHDLHQHLPMHWTSYYSITSDACCLPTTRCNIMFKIITVSHNVEEIFIDDVKERRWTVCRKWMGEIITLDMTKENPAFQLFTCTLDEPQNILPSLTLCKNVPSLVTVWQAMQWKIHRGAKRQLTTCRQIRKSSLLLVSAFKFCHFF